VTNIGWFPDPSGVPGQYRYWDGNTWSAETTTTPTYTPPPKQSSASKRDTSSKGWIIALIILALVTALVAIFLVTNNSLPTGNPYASADTNSAKPSDPGWDETTSATPSPPNPTDSGGTLVDCPVTTQTGITPQRNGWLTAGRLSVKTNPLPNWQILPRYYYFSFDAHYQVKEIYRDPNGVIRWVSDFGVSLLSNEDGFINIRTSAEQAMQCIVTGAYYEYFTERTDLISEQISINGFPAWRIRAEVRVDPAELDYLIEGDISDVIVVDFGQGYDVLGFFWSCYTIGDTVNEAEINAAIATLTVT
jgi:hypothetical protein